MATVEHYTQQDRDNIAARLGAIFGLENAGHKITREGWSLERWGLDGRVHLKVELVALISREEADAIVAALPMTQPFDVKVERERMAELRRTIDSLPDTPE